MNRTKKYYRNTNKEIKVGHIVVIKEGKSLGNEPGEVTKVTKVGMRNEDVMLTDNRVLCEDMASIRQGRTYQIGNLYLTKVVKIPSYYEEIDDIRLADEIERALYYARKKRWWQAAMEIGEEHDFLDKASGYDFEG